MKGKKGIALGIWGGLISFAVVMAMFGFILTVTSGIQQDVTNDYSANHNNSDYVVYNIGNQSLQAQEKLSQKENLLVTAGIGIFILGLLIAGLAMYFRG